MSAAGLESISEYDGFLLLSFGGPEGMDDVMPFLRNVTRGRNVPDSRLEEVAHHYYKFGGISPINAQNRALIEKLREKFSETGLKLPIYFGNRNWHPMLDETVAQMRDDGIKRVIAFATAAYSSYSSCRQYIEDIERACSAAGRSAPLVDKIAPYYNHPSFVEANESQLRDAIARLPEDERAHVHIAFTAHSIPQAMAAGCLYETELKQTAKILADRVGCNDWEMVYQSRSGSPKQPWLEPDICDHIRALKDQGKRSLVMAPIGFVSDHMEILYDLDTEAKSLCDELGITVERASTAGTHPAFVDMICQLVEDKQKALKQSIAEGFEYMRDCPVPCCPRQI